MNEIVDEVRNCLSRALDHLYSLKVVELPDNQYEKAREAITQTRWAIEDAQAQLALIPLDK